MKVLVLGHSFVVSENRKIWNELAQIKDVTVDLVLPVKWRSNLIKDLCFYPDDAADEKIRKIYPMRVFMKGNASFFLFNPFSLGKLLQSEKYDVILLAQETWAFSLGELNLLRFFGPNKNSAVYLWICQNLKKKQLFFMRFFERILTRKLTRILGCCQETAEVLSWKGITAPWGLLPFSYDGKLYNQPSFKEKTQKITLGYMGRLSHEKGLDLLLEASEVLTKKGVDHDLLIAGGGPLETQIKKNARVIFLGALPHAKAHTFYEKIDLFVLPSRTQSFWKEQFGRVIIESVASGHPVIGSSSGAIPEVMHSLKMPYIFKENDVEDLARVLLLAIDDVIQGKTGELMAQAGTLVHELYTHEKVASRAHEWFQKDKVERCP